MHVTSIYFARESEAKVVEMLGKKLSAPANFVSLPESPPVEAATALGLFQVRVWVPKAKRKECGLKRGKGVKSALDS